MTWTVRVRNSINEDVGELDQYSLLEMVLRLNDVSAWQLTVPADNPLIGELVKPGAGLRVFTSALPGTAVFTGPWTSMEVRKTAEERTYTFTGVDDTVWLKRRQASPSPTEGFPPYTVSAKDTVSNQPCSTVLGYYVNRNIGPDAHSSRKHPLWTYSANPGLGANVSGEARWQPLLTLLQELAVANGNNIGFKVIQNGGAYQLYPFQPQDRTATVMFSEKLGNLADFTYSIEAPEANYVYVGGDGEGTARTFKERSDGESIARWGRIEGELVDRPGTTDTTQLEQAGDEALIDRQEKVSLSLTPIESKYMRFGADFYLGDKVTVQLEGDTEDGRIQEVIREVKISLTPDGPCLVTPSVGTPGRQDIYRVFRAIQDIRDRLIYKERR
ncbi:siphovirus ReqiPepy6 Gp37-like family protein [Amycolatopsis thermoflava]|uniref:siphovirus ReqiPepy6 Gp37-like family protein n=1 Tax=Amycolatopsis thermoflava TaxID=84480 RepID=UPI0003F5034C|nr:siphovirus ReqiPepy6 Gp37-like family protein [Amycolatopsis thermoflava]